MYALQTSSLLEATEPPEHRGIARDEVRLLLTDRASGANRHARFLDLPSLLRRGDLLVVNDSATIPAAIEATHADGRSVKLHVSTKIDERLWMVEPRGEVLLGEELRLADGGSAVVIAPVNPLYPRVWYASFQLPDDMYAFLARAGKPIRYGYVENDFPLSSYQTMFARETGSSEMPSAARPFSPRVVNALAKRGVEIAPITLHCGVASFELPEVPATERYAVSAQTADAVNRARGEGRRVIAVGSTALRALASSLEGDRVVPSRGWTDLVIDDRRSVSCVDGLLTGFHDSAATHHMILRAFLGEGLLAAAYEEARERGYRQHEFGDSHLIL